MSLINVIDRLVYVFLEVCLFVASVRVIKVEHLAAILHLSELNRVLAKVLDRGDRLASNSAKHEDTAQHRVKRGRQALSRLEDVPFGYATLMGIKPRQNWCQLGMRYLLRFILFDLVEP